MKPFNFLSPKNTFNGVTFSQDVIDEIYNMCRIYHEFIDLCRTLHLEANPDIDPSTDFSYPIPNNPIEREFPEGKLWHAGSDYNEELNYIEHTLFLDHTYTETGDYDYYVFSVKEDDNKDFRILTVEPGSNVENWSWPQIEE
jgi:hypothetical protein